MPFAFAWIMSIPLLTIPVVVMSFRLGSWSIREAVNLVLSLIVQMIV